MSRETPAEKIKKRRRAEAWHNSGDPGGEDESAVYCSNCGQGESIRMLGQPCWNMSTRPGCHGTYERPEGPANTEEETRNAKE